MRDRAGRSALLVATLLLAPSAAAWAGSAQAPLSVGAIVPAQCVVSTPGSLGTGDASGTPVAMRCTKGTLPSGSATPSAGAVGPRISRDVVLAPALSPSTAPYPLAESDPVRTEQGAQRLVITVNF